MKYPPIKYPHRCAFWCAAIVVGFLQIWAYRYHVNPDGVSYIELAWAGLWHGLRGLVNGYWSPLYPALLGLAFRLVHPGPAAESTVVHLVNFAIFLANLACFEVFLRELLLLRAASPDPDPYHRVVPDHILWTWGYIFFLWTTTTWLQPMLVTPDLCVSAFCTLSTAILLRIRRGRDGAPVFLLLGMILGLAYLAKAFMFMLAWVILACAFWAAKSKSRALPRTLAATLVFLIIAAPEILALSHTKGRWTFGDTGALNYAWYVDRIPGPFWQGEPPRTGVPVHPVGRILEHPPTFEFAGPVGGSYPPTFDPSYWDAGLRPYFDLHGQLRVLARSASFFLQMFSRTGALYAVFLVLFLLLGKSGHWSGPPPRHWAVWMPCYAALAIYTLVQVDPRFIGSFALMLLMGLFAAVRPARRRIEAHGRLTASAMICVAAVAVAWSAASDLHALAFAKPDPQFQVAAQLVDATLFPARQPHSAGEPCPNGYAATIGDGANSYWAHLDGVRIVAGVPNPADFWQAGPQAQSQVIARFAELGIRAVVAELPHPSSFMDGWTTVPGTDFYIYKMEGPR